MQKFDYIISGAGIAGVTLTHQLIEEGKSVLLYDARVNYSSRIAAGLFNPITGRKMVKTWNADNLFPYLRRFYESIERITDGKFYNEIPIYRPFFSVEEQNDWLGKSSDPFSNIFIKKVYTKPQFPDGFNDPYGGIELNHSGWLDIPQYLDNSLRYFKINKLVEVIYNPLLLEHLKIDPEGISYQDKKADKIIFCEGIDLKNNVFFNWLPLQLLKGEILEVKLPFKTDKIFNRGVFVLPVDENKYKVGSTYIHNDTSLSLTAEGRKHLEGKLRGLVKTDFTVVGQVAGIRPTTKDRRPFLGQHPEHKNLYVFNGLGTKGVSLAPYFAHHFKEHFIKGKELLDEVNIKRFLSLYC